MRDLTDAKAECYLSTMAGRGSSTKRIGFLAYNGVQALDIFGPMDAFQEANEVVERRSVPYELFVVSSDGGPVRMSNGVRMEPNVSLADCPPLHTLIIPGGEGTRYPDYPVENIAWIKARAPELKRFGSICTGLYTLAQTGLVDGQRVTTHWHHAETIQQRFPALQVDPEAIFVRSGRVFSAAGVTAGIDLTLALIEEDLGPSAATEVARHLIVFLKRPGDQRQFSSVLQQQSASGNEFADLIAWIADNLSEDLSSFALAERVGLSERQFRRRFAKLFGETPTQRIERMRLEAAKEALQLGWVPVEDIALDVGYGSADTFRRAFERLLGVAPSTYRERFGKQST